ncbi:hypothetical protein PCK2_000582 [Pneumocystis canis]|nr:hypothetical protein PCK2_000582 [Pneumocystis canis]
MFESASVFKIVNILTAIIMILGGISQFFPLGFKNIIIGIYVIMFGIFTAILEFFIPSETAKYCSFFFSFLGRGICNVVPPDNMRDHTLEDRGHI